MLDDGYGYLLFFILTVLYIYNYTIMNNINIE